MLSVGCAASTSQSPQGDPAVAVVTRVIDGDTVDVHLPGHGRERVRLIGIDTPESVIPGQEPECFGVEAAERLRTLLPEGVRVHVERDVEARDAYGRLLAYVYRDGHMVNLALASEGFAEVMSIPPNTAWTHRIATAVNQARRERAGMWGTCTL